MKAGAGTSHGKGYLRFLFGVSVVLAASGVFHTLVFVLKSSDWEGLVSWRKPIVFAFSFAVTNLTIVLVLYLLPRAGGRGWAISLGLGLSSLGEVGLITLQQWRGVPSHFNAEGPFNLGVVIVLGVLFLPLLASLLGVAVWSWVDLPAPSDLSLGLQLGMGLLLVGQVAGVIILLVGIGMLRQNGGDIAALYPTVHRYRIPHALSLHAIQILAVIGALSDRAGRRRAWGRWILLGGSLGMFFVVVYSLWTA